MNMDISSTKHLAIIGHQMCGPLVAFYPHSDFRFMALNASLDALPNELLYEILRYLTRENDGAIPRRYRMTTTFASINRRLRQFALPHIFTEIRVPNYDRFRAMFVVFRPHLSRISSVRVGHPPLRRLSLLDALELYCDRLLPAVFDFVRLQNLV
ncbi:hypothetical protein C8R44DRAFT_847736, partial [Mycena epipterygia]